MSEQLKEALSAAVDGEADDFELRRVLDEASQDPEMREQWHRYNLIRDVLRKEPVVGDNTLRDRIWAEMEELQPEEEGADEPQLVVASDAARPQKPNWAGRITGVAVAATVAALVVFNGNLFYPETAPEVVAVPDITAPLTSSEGSPVVSAGTLPVMYTKATADDRLRMDANRMLHYQQRAMNESGGLSFVRMATFGLTRAQPERPASADRQQPEPQ